MTCRNRKGRARVQFDAKPLLQLMAPSSLRLQIVRGLAQLTQSTPAEIEALFRAGQACCRGAPRAEDRAAVPVGLELKIMRMLVAHPP